jgi:hypothetical protein
MKISEIFYLRLLKISALIILFFSMNFRAESAFILPGEELLYEVSYLGIKLCKIKIVTEKIDFVGKVPAYKAKAYIDTYRIPYVNFNGVFESWIDRSLIFTNQIVINSKLRNNPWEYQKVLFDYKGSNVIHGKWQNSRQIYDKKFTTKEKWCDPISLLFLVRNYANQKKYFKVATMMDVRNFYVSLNITGRRENIDIDACNYPVRSVYLNGNADFKGVYGLSGNFEGWVSDDDSRVPLKGKVDVTIGKVTIELIKWKRLSWMPPRGQ